MPAGPHPLLYDDQQLEQIALAIGDGSDLEKLKPFQERFEYSAFWYNASLHGSRLVPDRKLKLTMSALTNACARFRKYASIKIGNGQTPTARNLSGKLSTSANAILRRLGADKGSWDDRLPNRKLALLLSDEDDKHYELEDKALRRLAAAIEGYQANLEAAVAAVKDLAERIRRSQESLERVREHTVRKGNSGNMALNAWIADHMTLYEEITGRYARRSTTGTREPGGPLNRFVMASAEIVGIKASARSIDLRILRLLRFRRNAQKKI